MIVLVYAGVAVVLLAAAGMLRARALLTRLHLLSPASTVGAPLIGVGLAGENGWHLGTAAILLTVLLLAVTGPVLQSAAARLAANSEGLLDEELPS
ncbi:monovalent cation/H(+) antiporter subunit G [Amycolatopsis acidicola]|uniref:Monovalent cation/H(+) antiporter subunit G n=1 Tax=Amycolatopsis acidicola TaxID=2596893 RepID=A0A5N0UMS2_9PSEU|nr:monovalent cation/H(+) antiporter subunit G [Amycolatopsis acidicola]KAA9150309.1 monovalent cation/H(+) antiporter subunit G [Amycolatopsis acidicola]